MTRQELERLQAAGFSQEDIDAFVAQRSTRDTGMDVPVANGLPEIDLDSPSSVTQQAQQRGEDIIGAAPPVFGYETAFEVGPTAAKYAAIGAGGYGAYKVGRGLTNRFLPGQPSVPKAGPVAPAMEPGGQKLVDFTQGKSPNTPTAPQPAAQPAAPKQPGIAQRVAQIAYDKIAPMARAAAPYARGGMAALAAMTPGNIGQDYPFPTSGPLKGQEINPATRRPWTRMELDAYNAQQGR